MRKSTIIARCLVNSDMIRDEQDAEAAVHQVFLDEFPDADFLIWNNIVDDRVAQNIIDNVGRASRINVRLFIKDLWD